MLRSHPGEKIIAESVTSSLAEKDAWDKFELIFKNLILELMPIVTGVAASGVADSLKRGQLIQSLVDNLSQRDAKRDIALIALNDAITAK